MKQLTGLDALFIHTETHGLPMNISSLSIYDSSTAKQKKVDRKKLFEHIKHVAEEKVPVLHSKLHRVPMSMDQPYWEEDPEFDAIYHIHHVALPEPKDWNAVCQLCAELHAQPLNQKRALWQAYIIDNLDNVEGIPRGSFGLLLTVHHSMMDGHTGFNIFKSLHSLKPDEPPVSELPEFKGNEEEADFNHQSDMRLLSKAVVNNFRRSFRLGKLALQSAKLVGRRKDTSSMHPRTRFNHRVSPQRVIDRVKFPMEEIRCIKKASKHKTINDIALCIISGALRLYLDAKNELPKNSLVAGIPVDIRSKDDEQVSGNLINMMNISLCSNIEDPLERLAMIHESAMDSKHEAQALGQSTFPELFENIYSGLTSWAVPRVIKSGLLDNIPPLTNCIVTNVPGPPVDFYLLGARQVDGFGMGPLAPNIGLFHTVSTTCTHSHLTVAFTSCPTMMDDPQFYTDCLRRSFKEIQSQVGKRAEQLVATH